MSIAYSTVYTEETEGQETIVYHEDISPHFVPPPPPPVLPVWDFSSRCRWIQSAAVEGASFSAFLSLSYETQHTQHTQHSQCNN